MCVLLSCARYSIIISETRKTAENKEAAHGNKRILKKEPAIFPTTEEYKTIEKFYMNFDGDKDEFCEAYKKNEGFIAEKIQHEG